MNSRTMGVVLLLFGVATAVFAETGSTQKSPPSTEPATRDADLQAMGPQLEARTLSDITQLTHGFARAGEAYFSQDMKWIVFQASVKPEDQYQMYVARLKWDGDRLAGAGLPVRISPENSRNTCGYFSPDGKSLIYASTAGKEDPSEPTTGYQRGSNTYRWSFPRGMEIYRCDDWEAAVTTASAFASATAVNPTLRPGDNGPMFTVAKVNARRLTDNDFYDAECAYSPDGKYILFTSNRSGNLELWVMHADGSRPVQLTNAPGYNGGAFFSPDGKRLVYRCDRQRNNLLQIFTADVVLGGDGEMKGLENEKQVTNDVFVNWGPFWRPDGQHIIFATSRYGFANYELYLIRSDGSEGTRITYTPGADVLPVFSRDGNWLMWSSKRAADHTVQIFAARFTAP